MRTCGRRMRHFAHTVAAGVLAILMFVPAVRAQDQPAEDSATPESIVAATYESIERQPGGDFDWDRFRDLFLPEARLIPNTEQRGGTFSVISTEEFLTRPVEHYNHERVHESLKNVTPSSSSKLSQLV